MSSLTESANRRNSRITFVPVGEVSLPTHLSDISCCNHWGIAKDQVLQPAFNDWCLCSACTIGTLFICHMITTCVNGCRISWLWNTGSSEGCSCCLGRPEAWPFFSRGELCRWSVVDIHTVTCINACTHTPSVKFILLYFLSSPALIHCNTLHLNALSYRHLRGIQCKCVCWERMWSLYVCVCGSIRRSQMLLVNRLDIDTALTWMKIFCVQRAWKERCQTFGHGLFKQTLDINTQSNSLFTHPGFLKQPLKEGGI